MSEYEYVQYTYHFPYPNNSIDVRKITKGELEWAIETYNSHYILETVYSEYESYDAEKTASRIKEMFKTHFPEYLI